MASKIDKAEQKRFATSEEQFLSDKLSYGLNQTKIVLPDTPERMSVPKAIDMLKKLEEEMNTVVQVFEVIDAFPLEGAVAFMKAMARRYGWSTPLPGGFFQAPPVTMRVWTSLTEWTPIIWGRFSVQGIEGELATAVANHEGRVVFSIQGAIKARFANEVKVLADLTRRIVVEESIYRGKAIRLNLNRENTGIDYNNPPTFLRTDNVAESEVIFSDDLKRQIETNVFTPIKHTQLCVEHGIPLKRGVLLEGPYGTGKTLVSHLTGSLAVRHGWTYVSIADARAIAPAIEFARRYQPCVLFCEDIDRVVTGDRTASLDAILNTIDGIGSKGTQVMVVLTSNNAEKINKAMLRPGRLDAVIHVAAPDAKAAARLVRLYGRDMISPSMDDKEVGEALQGLIPAVIREVVERSKLFALSNSVDGQVLSISTQEILGATLEMKGHLEMLREPKGPSEVESALASIRSIFKGVVSGEDGAKFAKEAVGLVRYVIDQTDHLARNVNKLEGAVESAAMIGKNLGDKVDKVKDDTTTIRRRVS